MPRYKSMRNINTFIAQNMKRRSAGLFELKKKEINSKNILKYTFDLSLRT